MTQDGNVILPECWHPNGPPEPAPAFSFQMLYLDEFFALGRLTYRMGSELFVQHVIHDGAE